MKRAWFGPAVVATLGVAFAAMCLLVWLSRGTNARLVRRKLWLGGLLLTWTGAITGCENASCYETAGTPNGSPAWLELDQSSDGGTIEVNLTLDPTLSGTVHGLSGSALSFGLHGPNQDYTGNISAADGAFDEKDETFSFDVPAAVPDGDYQLRFFAASADAQSSQNLMETQLTVRVTR